MPIVGSAMPLCHQCGTPCAACRHELGLELPEELYSAHAIMEMEGSSEEEQP